MPIFRFSVVDVFTVARFAGNPLAVVLDADTLTPVQMQAVAREFGFSETAFVLRPADPAHDARVRIFTPTTEVPFAGHPNIGTAFVVAGRAATPPQRLMFEEAAGLVALDVLRTGETVVGARLTAPERLSTGGVFDADAVASALHLDPDDIATTLHPPMMASVGLPFLVVEIASRAALARARPDAAAFTALMAAEALDAIYLYTRETAAADGAVDWTARMFAPADGVAEDPATGSATAALAALLASRDTQFAGRVLRVAQGVYCARGQAENHIKAFKTHLAADRTSCTSATANQLWLFLHAGAYWLMWTLRAALPKRSPWRRAQFDTLRLRVVKIAARVVEMKTRITLHLPSACPAAPLMRLLLERLPRMAPV